MLFLGCLRLLSAVEVRFYFNEIKQFCLQSIVKFQHVGQAANSFANGLVKQGEDRSLDLVAIII